MKIFNFIKQKTYRGNEMNLFSQEYIEKLEQELEFASKTLGYFKENFNYFAHHHGGVHIADDVMRQLTIDKMKADAKYKFLKDYLEN